MSHSFLPPSSADKWMSCYGWLKATKGLPSKSSIYAEEGRVAHELLEMCLRIGVSPTELTGNLDMALNVSVVIDWLKKYRKMHKKCDYHTERWLHWGKVVGYPDLGGTADLAVVDPSELIIGDYKHGIGLVEVADNRQLILYLLGLRLLYGRRPKYRIIIFQPRARHEDGAVRIEVLDNFDLDNFAIEVKYAVEENIRGGRRVAGEHCRNYCLAAGNCKAFTLYSLEAAGEEFS